MKRTELVKYRGQEGHAAGGAVGPDTALQNRKVAGSISDGVTGIFH